MTTPTDAVIDGEPQAVPAPKSSQAVPTAHPSRRLLAVVGAVAVIALAVSVLLWQKLSRIQEQLARQSADTGLQALEAKTWAKQAQETVQDSTARVSLMEARLSEVALQRTQLEDLMQSLSRSRDETLVVDIESALRIAQQQAQMTGSTEPLLAALQSAQKRVQRAAQPRLTPVSRALENDLERLKNLPAFDIPGLMAKLDDGVALVEGLTLANTARASQSQIRQQDEVSGAQTPPTWWISVLTRMGDQIKGLVRVSSIESPEAALLSPEQAFFLRENLKLKLLNARLGLLARQKEGVRHDLGAAAVLVRRYAEPQSRRTSQLLQLLEQTSEQVRTAELPRIEASLTALNTAAAGR
jgi:uroporphyrin-III C-methyltransferase